MHNLNFDYLKKLNTSLSYKVTGAMKLYQGNRNFLNEIDSNYHDITTVMKIMSNKKMLDDFNFLLSKLKEHNSALESAPYLNSVEDISDDSIMHFKVLQDRIKSRRRELFSILYQANRAYTLNSEVNSDYKGLAALVASQQSFGRGVSMQKSV